MNRQKALEWVVGDDTGVSSKTMFAALMGVEKHLKMRDIPCDGSDFGRCYRFYKYAELTKEDLIAIKTAVPFFEPIIENWDKLCEMYNHDFKNIYSYMRTLWAESMILRGYVEESNGYWVKNN